jgi:hypothetical protein
MKAILSAFALVLTVNIAFADVTIEVQSVELNEKKSDGKAWDLKIPMKKGSELPDIFVEIKHGKQSILKTPVSKDTLSAQYTKQSVVVANAHIKDVTITVWDKDGVKNDNAGTITVSDQNGEVTLSGGGVKALKLKISGNEAPAAAPAKVEEAPAAEPVKAEEAPAAEPAKAEEAPAAEPAKAEEAPAAEPVEAEPTEDEEN